MVPSLPFRTLRDRCGSASAKWHCSVFFLGCHRYGLSQLFELLG